ncbi:MAG: winged helix-turn-helix domain-containing protein [Nitrospinales bacterium]
MEVVIPFAQDIAAFVSRTGSLPLSARRSFRRVLSAIKTMTLMYQKQRSRDEQGRFVADYIDYAIVYQLLEESFAESLGNVKRYTDDRIQIVEDAGMMTPRDLAERISVSTAAISQWLKPLIEKGVLTWCDDAGAEFGDDMVLEKAKRSGKAFLCVSGGNSLPSPFQLTSDPRWDTGGDLYAAYDLPFDDGSNDDDRAGISNDSAVTTENVSIDDGNKHEEGTTAVKVLSEKTNDDIKKMMETFRENQVSDEHNHEIGSQMYYDFSEMLSMDGSSSIN